jgi:tetratricopeptide (TPR) repeat protein
MSVTSSTSQAAAMANYLDNSVSLAHDAVDAQNPWLGLHAFTEELREYFYGRDVEADELFRRVNRKSLTVLFGQSGLGKTSLLRAGLFPRLRQAAFLPLAIRMDHTAQPPAPASQIIAALEAAAAAAGAKVSAPPRAEDATLWEYFHQADFKVLSPEFERLVPVLVFDQFEEVFTLGRATEELRRRGAQLLTELADLVENRPPESLAERFDADPNLVEQFDFGRRDYRVLVCLREDYLAMLEDMRQRMPSLSENRMRLSRMNGEQALDAVSRPGAHLASPSVSRQIVKFVAGGSSNRRLVGNGELSLAEGDLSDLEVEPALLSLFCAELNNRRQAMGLAEITPDLLAGNRETILRDYYERCLEHAHPEVRRFIEDELLTDSGYRENVALERAQRHLAQRGAPADALEDLVRRRLMHIEERLHVRRVELTHDVLTEVVRQSRDERQRQEQAEQARLREQQVRAELRKSRKRLVVVASVMAAFLALISGFGLFSYWQWQEAKRLQVVAQDSQRKAEEQEARAKKNETRANERAEAAKSLEGLARDFITDAMIDLNSMTANQPSAVPTFLAFLERSLKKFDDVLAVNREANWAQHQKAYFLAFASENAEKLGKRKLAVDYARQAVEALRQAGDDAEKPKVAAIATGTVAGTLMRLEEYGEAENALDFAFETLPRGEPERSIEVTPDEQKALRASGRVDPRTHQVRWTGYLHQSRGKLFAAQERWEDSLQAYQAGIALYERALELLEGEQRLRSDLVGFYIGAADALSNLDRNAEVIEHLIKAKDLRVALWKEADSVPARNQLAYAFEKLGAAYRSAKKLEESRQAYDNALRARRAVFVQNPGALPDDFVYDPETGERNLSSTLADIGSMEYDIGDPAIAREKFEEALKIARSLRERVPDLPNLNNLSSILVSWGNALYRRQEWAEAEKYFRDAVELRAKVVDQRPDDPAAKAELAFVLGRVGSSLSSQEKWSEALSIAERRVEMRRQVYAAANTPSARLHLGTALGNLSYQYLFAKQPEKALEAAQEALRLAPDELWIRTNEAHALLFLDRFDEAAKIYREDAGKMVLEDSSFADETRNDFRLLRKAGVEHPRMAEIEALLPPPQTEKPEETPPATKGDGEPDVFAEPTNTPDAPEAKAAPP